jgi:hypothetical protein
MRHSWSFRGPSENYLHNRQPCVVPAPSRRKVPQYREWYIVSKVITTHPVTQDSVSVALFSDKECPPTVKCCSRAGTPDLASRATLRSPMV